MSATTASTPALGSRQEGCQWLLTREARERLIDVIADLRAELRTLTGSGMEEGILRLPIALAAGRLRRLDQVLKGARVVSDSACAVIGRRALVRDESGLETWYWIGLPGEGSPADGWVSADSPLGAAILGARAGDVVEVSAPVGRWSVTLLAVGRSRGSRQSSARKR